FARLERAGLEQYEISNVARADFHSRHNVKYWQGGSWGGFGCGAHSTVGGVGWENGSATTEYVDRIGGHERVAVDIHRLSPSDRVVDALITGLRLTRGIDARTFQARYGVNPWQVHGESLAPCVTDGLAWRAGDAFGLTRRGMLVANEILQMLL